MTIAPIGRFFGLLFCAAAPVSGHIARAQTAAPEGTEAATRAAPLNPRLEILEVRVSKPFFGGGEPVWLDITLVNRSTKPAAFLMLGPKLEFKIKRDGKQVGLTYKAKDESKGDKISTRSVPVGGRFAYRVTLSRLFDLSRAGTYTLSSTKYLRNENLEPGADLVGPQILGQVVKFTVAETDLEPPPETAKPETAKPETAKPAF